MSANKNTSDKKRFFELGFVVLSIITVILIPLAFLMASCQKQEAPRYSIVVLEEKEKTNVSDEDIIINIPEENQTPIDVLIGSNQSGEPEIKENKTINKTTNEVIKEEQEQIPARANAVEFYFLLKGKSYFRYILKETELKTFNMSGTIISIVPIFIANDSVVFRIDDYTTGAVGYKEWFSTPGFEIYVSDIYFRG